MARNPYKWNSTQATSVTTSSDISPTAIAKRAYEKYLARGAQHGQDVNDWLEAERELRNEILRKSRS